MTPARRKAAVIGGGWAGCAAAIELARRGHHVTLFEAARTLGGRARCVELDGRMLDNGQHILLGAYTETLKLMETVGVEPGKALLRLPLQMRYPTGGGGMDFVAPNLPGPLHILIGLLRAKGLTREDKLALARFSTTVRWIDWQLHQDCSVTELLERYDQTDRLIKLMWRPLCIAALNTPPERASAQVFLNVLRDSLGARRAASDMLIPRIDLSALFPQKAAAFIERHGGAIACGTSVKRLCLDGTEWILETGSITATETSDQRFHAVVIATPPPQAAALLDGLADTSGLTSFGYEPITTCYLQYEPEFRLEQPFFALIDDATTNEWGQFVFDRGQIEGSASGLLSVVVSASSAAMELGHQALTMAITAQLARVFTRPELANPVWSKVISEKRATFSCQPGLRRPENTIDVRGLVLAGDYTACDYPATLESAIRSGIRAARCVSP